MIDGFATPESSNIDSVQYDDEKRELAVTFKRGGTYVYERVSPVDYIRFKAAPSKNGFLNSNIKGKYNFRRV